MSLLKPAYFLLLSPVFFVLCMLQAAIGALLFVLVAQPFGRAWVFKVGYEEPEA